MTPESTWIAVEVLRASADQLRAVIEAIDSGTVEASGRERAFIAGSLWSSQTLSQGNAAHRLANPAPDGSDGQTSI